MNERVTFTNLDKSYTLVVYSYRDPESDREFCRVVIRETDTNLFVRSWERLDPQQAESLIATARRNGTLVLQRDRRAMQVLEYLETYHATHGHSPKIREIVVGTRLPAERIASSIDRLVDTGFVRRERNKIQGITLIKRRVDA